eukprot:GFUD01020178.1.p1 GENE.GFUD01020178.1~~GFUD01020178.1.p1  ORF type:complete len:136 (+),score=46.59 GFUD01020178.1:137-544(+)
MSMEEELKPDVEAAKLISEKELVSIEIKELNKKVKEKGVSKELGVRLKQRRRTLKNRSYATSCREKRDIKISNLEKDKNYELQELKMLEEENDKLRENVSKMAARYKRILEFAKQSNVNLDDMSYQISPGERPSD